MDERIKVFAHNLIHKSIQVKPGDNVYIHYTGEATEDLGPVSSLKKPMLPAPCRFHTTQTHGFSAKCSSTVPKNSFA